MIRGLLEDWGWYGRKTPDVRNNGGEVTVRHQQLSNIAEAADRHLDLGLRYAQSAPKDGAALRPRRRKHLYDFQGWGIFDRHKGEFSSGIDKPINPKFHE